MLIGAPNSSQKETPMKLRSIATVLAIALASAAAYAQSGVYVTFDAQQFTRTGIYANPGPHGNVDKPWLFGPSYGVYYDVTHLPKLGKLNTGPLVFGIDARGDVYRDSIYGSQIDREDGIFSLRAATKRADLRRRIVAEGHEVGNHSYSHPYFFFKSRRRMAEEIDRTQAIIEKVVGFRPNIFRPPYGARWFGLVPTLLERGMLLIQWSATR